MHTGGGVEPHWRQAQLAMAYGVKPQTISAWIDEGRFGPIDEAEARHANLGRVLRVDRVILVPASRVRFFEERHSIETVSMEPVRARSEGEARRKLREVAA